MKIIYNKRFPFFRFSAINLFGVIFVRKEFGPLSDEVVNHEKIHTAQMKEMLFLFFYLWYLVEWIIRLVKTRNGYWAYRTISFEKEAYQQMHDADYLQKRKMFSWFKYLRSSMD